LKTDIIVLSIRGNLAFFMLKGGIMKREVIAAVAVLSLVFAVPAFAVEGTQPSAGIDDPLFWQIKDSNLKRLDDRINILEEEKACVRAAENQDDLDACTKRTRRRLGFDKPGTQIPPQMK
jgi:hypothetical protein